MSQSRTHARWIVPAALLGVVAAFLMVTGQPDAHAQDGADQATTKIGTYDAQTVFQAYPGTQELMTAYQDAQQKMQQAQQNGDRQAMQRVQQEVQAKQQEVVGKFETAVDNALPEVAEEAGVDVVALEVVYTADGVAETDLTEDLTAALGGEAEAAAEQAKPQGSGAK